MSDVANKLVLVLGGARSGKSGVAERLAAASGLPVTYIATAEAKDEEMQARVARHRAARPAAWRTVEAPYDIPAALAADAPQAFLIDCLTIYISNWLLRAEQQGLSGKELEQACLERVDEVIAKARSVPGLVVIVSNEVGQGVVPAYPLGRVFRDVAGWANQRVAAAADQVLYCIAGIPVDLKQLQCPLPE